MLIFSLDESWERIAEFPSQPGAMCTALRFAGSKLLAAFSTGHVRVYDVRTCHSPAARFALS